MDIFYIFVVTKQKVMSRTIDRLPFQRHMTWNDYKETLCAKYGVSINSMEVVRFDYKITKSFEYFQSRIMGESEFLTEKQIHAIKRFVGFIDGEFEFDIEYNSGLIYLVASKGSEIIGSEYVCPAMRFSLSKFKEFLFKNLPDVKNKLINNEF